MEEPNARARTTARNYPCPDCGGPTRGEQNRKRPRRTRNMSCSLRVCRTPDVARNSLHGRFFCARVPFTGPRGRRLRNIDFAASGNSALADARA